MQIKVEYDNHLTHKSESFSEAITKHLDQLADRGLIYREPKGFTYKQFKAVLKHLDTKIQTI